MFSIVRIEWNGIEEQRTVIFKHQDYGKALKVLYGLRAALPETDQPYIRYELTESV